MSNKTNRLNKKLLSHRRKKMSGLRSANNNVLVIVDYLKEGTLIILLALSIFFLISFLSYHPFDPGWSRTAQHMNMANMAGSVGAWCADLFLYFFGIAAYLFPVMILSCCLAMLINKKFITTPLLWVIRILGFCLTIMSGTTIISILSYFKIIAIKALMPVSVGGVIGDLLKEYFCNHTSFLGSLIILIPAMLAGITGMTGISWLGLAKFSYLVIKKIILISYKVIVIIVNTIKNIIEKIIAQAIKINKKQGAIIKKPKIQPKSLTTFFQKTPKENDKSKELLSIKNIEENLPKKNYIDNINAQQEAAKNFLQQIKHKLPIINKNNLKTNTLNNKVAPNKNITKPNNNRMNDLPTINLLEKPPQEEILIHTDDLPQASNIQDKLADFNISVQISNIFPGPVITRVELQLAPGTKANKITSLSKDLARSLSVPSVRVVEVIPGKPVVGLEIPNKRRVLVCLSEILSSEQYITSNSPLTLALGKDISGTPVIADLSKMPHLLVAGTTGSGKSVGVNVMLLSILFKATPDEVRLILIDPKMLELSIYDGIPHLLTPVVTDMKDAANALNWCVFEMEKRYKLMASIGVRNLISFNHKVQTAKNINTPIAHPFYNPAIPEDLNNKKYLEKLPYIVVIIDEFADMMMVVGKKVEEQISRIAQKARAAGIHMILATQRPSVDVITGLIKANIPTRIAFQVSSRIDSRTILDQQGAEQLLGNGDLLYLPPGSGIPVRIHGAFVSDEEVHKVVAHIKELAKDSIPENNVIDLIKIPEKLDSNINLDNLDETDPLYNEAVAIVTTSRKASISYLQRRLKIGFNRAARLIEEMQNNNVVSMQNNGTREVLAPSVIEDNLI